MERFTRPSCLAMLNTNVLRDDWLEEKIIPPRLNDTLNVQSLITFPPCVS